MESVICGYPSLLFHEIGNNIAYSLCPLASSPSQNPLEEKIRRAGPLLGFEKEAYLIEMFPMYFSCGLVDDDYVDDYKQV